MSFNGTNDPKIPNGIHKIKDAKSSEYPDLAPLSEIVENAKIVGIGESVHTSSGFYQYKARVIRFLVKEMSFRHLGFETSTQFNKTLHAFLSDENRKPKEVLKIISPIFNDESIVNLLEWIKEWNTENPDDQVNLFGFDNEEKEWGKREPFMEDYIKKYSKGHPGEKVIIWSHNGHISKNQIPSAPGIPFGKGLFDYFQKDYFSIGLLANRTGYHFIGADKETWFVATENSLEKKLSELSKSPLLIESSWLKTKAIGKRFHLSVSPPVDIAHAETFFSALIYLPESPPITRVVLHPDES